MATAKALKNLIGYENLDIVLSELDTSDWGCNVVMRMKSYSSGKEKLRNLLEGSITQRSNKDIDEIVNTKRTNTLWKTEYKKFWCLCRSTWVC